MSESALSDYGHYIPPDRGITYFGTGHNIQRITVNENFLLVEDPWLGDFIIGSREDRLFYDFFTTPNAYRSMGVSQLCKSQTSSTIPNVWSFNRLSGLVAQHEFIERMGRDLGATDDQMVAYHVAAEGDDQGHPGFSHAFEQAVQKWGGPENYHEMIWPMIAFLGGTTRVLDRHSVAYDSHVRVPNVAIPPWVARELKQDIDADNFQYIAAEGLMWFDHDGADPEVRKRVRKAFDPNGVEVTPDGQLAFKSPEDALIVSKILLLLATEHWNDPINRTQLHLQIQGGQRSIVKRRLDWMDDVDKGETRKPEDYLHAIDNDFVQAMETGPGRADDFMYVVSNSLNSIAREERRRFIDYKLPQYTAFLLDDRARNYPSEYLEPKRVEFGPRNSSVSTKVVQYSEEDAAKHGGSKLPRLHSDTEAITYTAGPLKNRFINPLVRWKDGHKRLSEINDDFKELLREQQYLQGLGVEVQLVFASEYTEDFREGIEQNEREFEQVRHRSGLTEDQKRKILEIGAERSKELAQASGALVLKHAA